MIEALRLLLVYAASCALVLWLVHRTLRPLSPAVAVMLALLPFVFTGKAMVTGGHYGALNLTYHTPPLEAKQGELPEDEYHNGILMDHVCQVIPWRKAVREAVKTGHWPLWNRYARGGDLLLGAGQPAPFDPKVWLGFLLPLATAITFACSFAFFQAASFTWLYLRDLGVGDGAALVGAAAFTTSQFFSFWVGWSMSSVWAVLPLLLAGVRRLARGQRGGFGATVAASTLALVGGHPETVLHISAVAFVALLLDWPWRSGVRAALPRLRRTLLAALTAGALAAPALLPFVEAMVQSADYHARQRTAQRATHGTHSVDFDVAAHSALGAVYPWAYGRPRHDLVDAKPERFDQAVGVYLGGAALLLALLGTLRPPATTRRSRGFFAVTGAVTLGVAVGLPGVTEAVSSLPLFDITLNGRLSGVAAFSFAVLAALGAERLMAERRAAARDESWTATGRILVAGAAALTVGGLLHFLVADLPADVERVFLRSLVLLLVPALALAAWFPSRRLRPAGRVVAPVLLLLLLAPKPFETPDFYRSFDSRLFFPPIPEFAELPDFQRDGSEPYRVTAPYNDLLPATSALWHLEDVRGFAVMRHVREYRTLSLWCERSTAWWFCQIHNFRKPFLSALNVRYVVARPDLQNLADWNPATRGEHVSIWENPRTLPRAFAPHTVLRLDPGAELPRVIHDVPDFGAVAAIEFDAWPEGDTAADGTDVPARAGDGRNPDFRSNPRARIRTRAEGPDLRLDVETDEPTWIVVSETPWKGWRAIDQDGDELPLTYANLSMLAFRVDAGRHEIQLVYRPRSFFVGLVLAALSVVALAAVALIGGRAARRRSRSRVARPV